MLCQTFDVFQNETGVVSDTLRPPMFEKARPFLGGRWDKEPDFVGPQTKPPQSDDGKKESDNESENEVQMFSFFQRFLTSFGANQSIQRLTFLI